MNYILEIKAFEQWLETHYLPILPQLLWYKLMYFCNRSGWSEWVTVDNLRLMAALQMSREATLIKARGELIKAGLIEYQKGKKGSPNRYRMISLAEKNTFKNEVQSVGKDENTFKNVVESEVHPVVQSVAESEVYPVVQSVAIDKQKQEQKRKQKNSPPISPAERFEEFLLAYPKACNRFLAECEYKSLLLTGKITEDELVQCALNYAEACRLEGIRYIYNAENFLKKFVFEQYLPGKYRKPVPKNKKGSFNNFHQREYDFGELEKQLLSSCAGGGDNDG